MKSEMNVFDHGCLSLGLSDAGPSGAAKTAWILCGSNWTSCPRCIDFFKRTRTNNMISVIRIYLLLANSSNDSRARPSQYMQVKKNVPTESFVFCSSRANT